MANYCTQCGSQLAEDGVTCPNCTAQQYQQPAQQYSTQQYQQPAQQYSTQQYQQPAQQYSTQQYQQPAQQYSTQQYQQPAQQYSTQQYQQPAQQYDTQQYQQPIQQYSTQQYAGNPNLTASKNRTPIKFDSSDETNATISIFGNNIKVSIVLKCIAVALCLFFFLPMFSVSCSGTTINFSGLESTFGKTISVMGERDRISGNFLAVFLFLIPAVLFTAQQFKKKIPVLNGKLFLVSTGLSGLGFLTLIIYAVGVNNRVADEMGGLSTPDFTFWYYFSFFLYIISAIVSLGCLFSSSSSGQKGYPVPGLYSSQQPPPQQYDTSQPPLPPPPQQYDTSQPPPPPQG